MRIGIVTITILLTTSIQLLFAAPLKSQPIGKVEIQVGLDNETLLQAFKKIEAQSPFHFMYRNEEIKDVRNLNLPANKKTVEEFLKTILEGTSLTYRQLNDQILIMPAKVVAPPLTMPVYNIIVPQAATVKGKVTSQEGEPLVAVNIAIKGTTNGTTSDIKGNYSLTVPDNATLVFSYVGYMRKEVVINGRAIIDVRMEPTASSLEQVVVVGYGTHKKETVTGAIASVGTKELVQSPQANVSNALVGRMTGILSVQREGQPGGDQSSFRIRGAGTFTGSTDPLIIVDGVESLNYNNIDPNEIESVTVLKDASATAVYGVRGANGVLIITTKKGKTGGPVLSVSSNIAVVAFTDLRKNLSSYDWSKAFNEALKYNSYFTGSYTPMFSEADIEHYRTNDDPIFHPSTDWVSLMMKPYSTQKTTNVNISGGTDVLKYFISAGYFDQQGLFNNTKSADGFDAQMKYRRYNFRSNFDINITKRFTANINVSSQIEEKDGPTARVSYIIDRIYNAPPNNSPGIVDGKVINVYDVFGGNPLEQLLGTGLQKQLSSYLTSTVRLNYDLDFITKGLNVHGTMSYWNFMSHSKIYAKAVPTYKPILLPDNTILYSPQKEDAPFGFSEASGKNRKTYLEFGVNYARQFGKHNVTGLVLYNQSKLYDPLLAFVVPNGYQGLVGRVTYDYSSRYLAEFDIGYNGTENFAPGRRFGVFPAYSLGWVVTEEPFFPKNKIVSFIKVRGSYGEVGNDKLQGTRFLYNPTSYTYTGSYNFGEAGSTFQSYQASAEGTLGNPLLTWERAKKANVGMDLTLLDEKVGITTDVFVEHRDNILTTKGTTPNLVGISLPPLNLGKMKNSGFELEINYHNQIKNFNYWVKGIYTYAHNVIQFQDEVQRPFTYQNRTGQSYGQPFGLVAEGFYNTWEEVNNANRPKSSWQNNLIMPGDLKYKDINGDGVINADDQVPIGYPNFPEISYGLSLGGSFKGFDISVLFQGATHVSRVTYITSVRPFENNQSSQSYIPDLAWTQERYEQGLPIKLPHLSAQQVQVHDFQSSTFMIQDASYVRLKNAEIGYAFSSALLKRAKVTSLRVYLNCFNLFTWDNLYPGDDPEQISTGGDYGPYPNTRTLNLGVNIKF